MALPDPMINLQDLTYTTHELAWLRFASEPCGLLMDETAGSPIENASGRAPSQ
jgi:hypothetical protein